MKKKSGNATQFALLGLLFEAPMTGYAIKKAFDESVNHFWNVSYGQIYPELRRLVAKGHATVKEEPGRKGSVRKVYRITPRGREALRDWLAKAPAIRPPRSEMALKLRFGAPGRLEDHIAHLECFGAGQERQLRALREIEKSAGAGPGDKNEVFALLTVRMGIALSEAMANWARESVRTLRQSVDRTVSGPTSRRTRRADAPGGRKRVHSDEVQG